MDEEWCYQQRQKAVADAKRHKAKLGTSHRLPRLRVRFSDDGRLLNAVFKALGPQDAPDDAWWQAAAHDWRRGNDVPGAQCLGWFPNREMWTFVCEPCGIRKTFAHAELLKRFGEGYYLSNLSYDAVLCPKMRSRKQCRLTFE